MAKLFKKIPSEKKKSVRLEIRITEKEADAIRVAAFIRNLSVSDFMRRAAFGRRADVGFEVEIVLTLRDVVQSIRGLHEIFVIQGFPPPSDELGAVLDAALAAMLRVSK